MLPDPAQQPTLTVEEAAELLGLGRSATYEGIRSGEIPSLRVGRLIRVPTAALLGLLGHGSVAGDMPDPSAAFAGLTDELRDAAEQADVALSRLREAVAAAGAVARLCQSGTPAGTGVAATTDSERKPRLVHSAHTGR